MKLISLNVGRPQPYFYHGKEVFTSIFKSPVDGLKFLSAQNIEGDEQSDLSVHGGLLKAVYSYDLSYYAHWKTILDREDWNYGLFGENLTTEGLPDDKIRIGDIFQVGSAVIMAVQPRFPCFKLNIRFDSPDMVRKFTRQRKNGTYFSVLQHGNLQAGDDIRRIEQSQHSITIQDLVDCYYDKGSNSELLNSILAIDFLPPRLRVAFESFVS